MFYANQVQLRTTIKSGAAITSGDRFVKQNSTGELALAGNLEKALGVLEKTNSPSVLGQDTPVAISGIVTVETGGSVDYGVPVTSDAVGRAISVAALSINTGVTAVTSGAANGSAIFAGGKLPTQINGYALEKATGSGQFIRVRLV